MHAKRPKSREKDAVKHAIVLHSHLSQPTRERINAVPITVYTGWPKKVSRYQSIKKTYQFIAAID